SKDRETEKRNIYNKESQKQIADYLQRQGKLTNNLEPFDYTALPWQQWHDWHFNHYPVKSQKMPELSLVEGLRPDGLQAALAGFTLRALAKGHVKPNGKGGHTITVTEVSVYVDDRFAFQMGETFHLWSCEKKEFRAKVLTIIPPSFFELTGSDFLRFQDKYNIGRDFFVLTPLHPVESFQEKSYDWP
ncbi:MAG: DUF6402 family protein, partial [Desulfobulbus sp.]|nr:DUF6402 family protein [Desulfobulbus sp.]